MKGRWKLALAAGLFGFSLAAWLIGTVLGAMPFPWAVVLFGGLVVFYLYEV